MTKQRDSRPTVARNVDLLKGLQVEKPSLRKVAAKAGMSPQTVNNLFVDSGPSPRLDNLDKLAASHGLETWMLLLPVLPSILRRRKELALLIERYANTDEAGQKLIEEIAERAARTPGN